MQEPRLPDRIISFLGLLPSTLFLFGSTSLVVYELSKTILKSNLFLMMGVLLITTSFTAWFWSLLWGYFKVIYYRWKYSLRKINKEFYIISFNQTAYLLDNIRKEIRWIKNWQTALDLGFVGEWTDIKLDIKKPSALLSNISYLTKDGQGFRLCDFIYVNGIHTRGTVGT